MRQRFLRLGAALLLIALTAAFAPLASAQSGTRIVYKLKGALVSQDAATGKTRPITAMERLEWQAKASDGKVVRQSPDGSYYAPEGNGYLMPTKNGIPDVCTQDWHRRTFANMGLGTPDHFGGWLSDRYFVVEGQDGNSNTAYETRAVVDSSDGQVLSFNGWPSTDWRVAVVPEREGVFRETFGFRRSNNGGYDGTKPNSTSYYVASLPVPITAYHIASTKKVPLSVAGKPFRASRVGRFTFSADRRWVLFAPDTDLGTGGSYLFSASTGMGRYLAAGRAIIVPPTSEGTPVALDKTQKKALDTFFTNFAETETPVFRRGMLTDRRLITFGMMHAYMNTSDLPASGDATRVSAGFLNRMAERYFGRKIKNLSGVPKGADASFPVTYKNGVFEMILAEYLITQIAEVERFARLPDGDYVAYVRIYEDESKAAVQAQRRAVVRRTGSGTTARYVLVEYMPLLP